MRIQKEQKQVERCRKSSSDFMLWEVDASCSHCQDREDDDPQMAASWWVTGVCIYGPKTQHLTCLAPKARTCGTPNLVPEQRCDEHQELEAHQILQKHS